MTHKQVVDHVTISSTIKITSVGVHAILSTIWQTLSSNPHPRYNYLIQTTPPCMWCTIKELVSKYYLHVIFRVCDVIRCWNKYHRWIKNKKLLFKSGLRFFIVIKFIQLQLYQWFLGILLNLSVFYGVLSAHY